MASYFWSSKVASLFLLQGFCACHFLCLQISLSPGFVQLIFQALTEKSLIQKAFLDFYNLNYVLHHIWVILLHNPLSFITISFPFLKNLFSRLNCKFYEAREKSHVSFVQHHCQGRGIIQARDFIPPVTSLRPTSKPLQKKKNLSVSIKPVLFLCKCRFKVNL